MAKRRKRRRTDEEGLRERVRDMIGKMPFSEDAMFGLLCSRFPKAPSEIASLALGGREVSIGQIERQRRPGRLLGRRPIYGAWGRDSMTGMPYGFEMQRSPWGMPQGRVMYSLCALGLDALMDGEGYGAWRGCALIAICERPL